jgi:heat shock protein HtpX
MTLYDEISSNNRSTTLLFLLYMIFYAIVVYLFLAILGFEGDLTAFIITAVAIAAFSALFIFSGAGTSMLLALTGARQVTKKEYPYLVNAVEALSIGAGIPMPKTYVIESDTLNAFATGLDSGHSHVVVTTGLLQKMNRIELEGVLAHEISHIRNLDIRTMLVAAVLAMAIALLADIGIRSLRARSSGDRGKGSAGIVIIAVIGLILAPIIATLIRLAISRNREYAADASGAMLTRYPPGLASALDKIRKEYERDPTPTPGANDATRAMFIFDPMRKSLTNMFSTHPPVEDRIKRLKAM